MRFLAFIAALALLTNTAEAAGPFIWYGPYAKNIAASGEQNPDGTAAAPSLTFSSDTDTGVYRAGANQLGIATGGSAKATVDTEWNMLADLDIGSQKVVTGASRFLHREGTNSVFLGVSAGTLGNTGASNTGVGVSALGTITSGTSNTAVGTSAAFRTETAGEVTAIGANAGRDQTGNTNTWVGSSAGLGSFGSSDGIENTGVGVSALQLMTSGDFNTGVGTYAGRFITSGSNNTAVGYQALYGVNSGTTNVGVGQNAGDTITTGTANTFLGTNADAGSSGLTNATAIGANATVSASNALVLGSGADVGIGTNAPGSKLDVKGTLRLSGATSGYVGLAPAATAGSTTYTLPTADGAVYDSLTTNGSGTLSWAARHKKWNTVVKTANYTAVSYDEILADLTGGAFTITLPASPATGDRVRITISKSNPSNTLTIESSGGTIGFNSPTGTSLGTSFGTCSMTGEFVYDGTDWNWINGLDFGGCT